MVGWLDLQNPFSDTAPGTFEPPNTLAGLPIAVLARTSPELLAAMMVQNGIRPGAMPIEPKAPMPVPGVEPSPEPTPTVNKQSALQPTAAGPAGLTGNAGNKIAQALGAVKAVQPPAAQYIPAPATPRIDTPPVYKPDATQLLQVMQMLAGSPQMPSLAQLMGGLR